MLEDVDHIEEARVEYFKSIYDPMEMIELHMNAIKEIQLRSVIDQVVVDFL